MNGLWLIDWGKINTIFCIAMWILVFLLACVVIGELMPHPLPHHPAVFVH